MTMYYAFFAKRWKGPLQLGGLEYRTCTVNDYVNDKSFRTGNGQKARVPANFEAIFFRGPARGGHALT
jgi:hypothetical protein